MRGESKILRLLAKEEDVLSYLVKAPVSEGRKQHLATVWAGFARYCSIPFEKPRYRQQPTLPFIPLEAEIEALIATGRSSRHAATLLLLKETGVRIGEASRLQFKDFDFERKTVRVTAEKGSNPRELKLSNRLIAMLQQMFALKQSIPSKHAMNLFVYKHRKILAEAQNNPRFPQIHLHTFRHH